MFEIALDLFAIIVLFLLVGTDRNATKRPVQPEQQDEAPTTPPIDTEAVVKEAIATMPKLLVAGSVRLAEVLTFPSRTPAPVVEAPAKRKRGRPPGSGKKKLAPALAG